MPLQATSGAASYDAFGGGVAAVPNYIEDVFSTWLYTGNGSTQTITNGIDLAGKGGLVWIKSRNYGDQPNVLNDTARGAQRQLVTNAATAQTTVTTGVTAFTSSGFSLGAATDYNLNFGGDIGSYASWTFREAPKFFDVVTYTGNGIGPSRAIPHNLGSAPGCIIVKKTSATQAWAVYHRSVGTSQYLILNGTNAAISSSVWGDTTPTSTDFYVSDTQDTNGTGQTYVAYLFAHNAGGFGLTGTDNVISCGSYTGNGSTTGPTVTLGYEPQWLLIKKAAGEASGGEGWAIWDNIRNSGLWDDWFLANSSQAEQVDNNNVAVQITSTGFFPNAANNASNSYVNTSGATYIYIAIRRGPMKVPTTGTSVFTPNVGGATTITTNFPVDLSINTGRNSAGRFVMDRLRGSSTNFYNYLETNSTAAEIQGTGAGLGFDNNTGFVNSSWSGINWLWWSFRRAPGFFDEVCYTGTGVARTVAHNLAAVPELMIIKSRTGGVNNWGVYNASLGNTSVIFLNLTNGAFSSQPSYWNSTTPTSSVFSVGTSSTVNASSENFVAYLFATCPGVSKVGSYTGTGATQVINCGFTGGARFVLIKKTSGTGSWYVWDSSRGIVAGNDPYLLLNSTAAEVTNTDYVDTASVGFEISSTAPSEINENGGSFIFLAIA